MGLMKEFKTFAMKGNVMDMAVGIIIGGAFGKIISSLVVDVIMPMIWFITGGLRFAEYKIILRDWVSASPDNVIMGGGGTEAEV